MLRVGGYDIHIISMGSNALVSDLILTQTGHETKIHDVLFDITKPVLLEYHVHLQYTIYPVFCDQLSFMASQVVSSVM